MGNREIKIVKDIDDNLPFSGDYPCNEGNTVVKRIATNTYCHDI